MDVATGARAGLRVCPARTPARTRTGDRIRRLLAPGAQFDRSGRSDGTTLVSRERLERGELQQIIRELAGREYAIPGTRRRHLGEKTIQAWYYAWRAQGIDGLVPKTRIDRGQSKLAQATQTAILAAKRDNPRRSIRQIRQLLETAGTVAAGSLSRSTIHRLLQQHGLSRSNGSASLPEEKRSFVAASAGAIWYGDVMHGPRVPIGGRLAKSYLVSLFDDASRLVAHSAFCPGETALDIEGVLKQALLKRGVPIKRVVDNGAAYRAQTLQGICARLGIHLIHCRPYAPEGKGKLERWHRGESIGSATPLDALANLDRRRRKPDPAAVPGAVPVGQKAGPNLIELAYQQYHRPTEA